jgi:hypothetical protein
LLENTVKLGLFSFFCLKKTGKCSKSSKGVGQKGDTKI